MEVVGVDRFSDYYDVDRKRANVAALVAAETFELVEGNLTELDLRALLDGVEVVFHLAGQPGVRASWGSEFDVYLEDNVRSTQQLLEAARDSAGLRSLVYSSSSSIYGDAEALPTLESATPRPISPYGVTKLAAEHLCHLYSRSFEVPAVAVRYFTVFGPRQRPDMAIARFIDAAIAGEPIELYGSGEQRRDFTYVADAVAGTVAAAAKGRPGSSYNIAGGNEASVLDVIAGIEHELGTAIEVEHLPVAAGDARETGAEISLARRELGYEPTTSLGEGLANQVADRRRQLSAPR